MRVLLRAAFCIFGLAGGYAAVTHAQMDETSYVVTYIEVAPSAAEQTAKLLTEYVEASREMGGNMNFQALQRIGQPNHFAVLEIWRDAQTRDAHASSARAERFRTSLDPLLYCPIDAREHGDLATAAGAEVGPDGVFAVTHVDVTPNNTDVAVELLNKLAAESRRDNGNGRFDVLVQSNRRNHMTVVEAWEYAAAREAHYGAEHTKTFRASVFPLSGALYDERLYRALH